MKIRGTGIVITLSSLFLGLALEVRAGSIFSLNLLGENLPSSDARAVALGGDLQLIPDSLGVLQKNPAMLALCRKVTVGAAQFVAMDKGRSTEYSEQAISVKYPMFMLTVPVTNRLGFALGYRARYDPDGSFSTESRSGGGESYRKIFTKSGGLYSVPLALSFAVSRLLALGFYYSLERGSLEDSWEINFDDPSFADGVGEKREELSGVGFGAGVLLFPEGRLAVGALYESKVRYEAHVTEKFTQSSFDTTYGETIELPAKASLALSFRLTSSWTLLGSASLRDFGEFRGLGYPTNRLFSEESYSIGMEYQKGSGLKSLNFPFRFSFNFQRLPFDYPEGKRVEKYIFAIGTGLIFGDGKGKIDIALQAGKVGSIRANGVEDRIVRLYASVTGSEVWKRRRVSPH